MTKYIVLSLLALATITCAVIEGLIEVSPQFTQFIGALSILCTAVLVGWSVFIKTDDLSQD